MEHVVCIKHPSYKGKDKPILSCKTCCGIFVAEIKSKNQDLSAEETYEWIAKKKQEAEEAIKRKQNDIDKPSF